MDRLFFREKPARACGGPDRKNIAVTGIGRGCGTTLAAVSLALHMAEQGGRVSYTECGVPAEKDGLLYVAAGMDQRFGGRRFHDFYRLIADGQPVRDLENREMDVSWVLITPEDAKADVRLSERDMGRLLLNAREEWNIFDLDISTEEGRSLMNDMDACLVLADPLPSKLARETGALRFLKKLEVSGQIPFRWAVNRMNPGVTKRQIRSFLKSGSLSWIPDIPARNFYEDEFRCLFHWENPDIKEALSPLIGDFSRDIGFSS